MDSGMKCLITIAGYHGIGADEEHLRHVLSLGAENIGTDEILRIGRRLKLKTVCTKTDADSAAAMPLPAMLRFRDGTYGILIRAEKEKYLVMSAEEQVPGVLEREEFCRKWDGTLFLFTPRLSRNQNVKFGIKWFIPTILRFKKPLMEVLLAALVMQLLAVVSPLITQSVIDKVLVHGSTMVPI